MFSTRSYGNRICKIYRGQVCSENFLRNSITTCTTLSNNFKSKTNKVHIYQNLFDWKNKIDFAKQLASNVVYKDDNLVAIVKPWGVGMHFSIANSPNVLNSEVYGEPRFCVANVLDYLSQLLEMQNLKILKSCHRQWSGLMLLSNSSTVDKIVQKSIRQATSELIPYRKFYCITNGIATEKSEQFIDERCGISLVALDELGQNKEPVYLSSKNISKKMRKSITQKDNKLEMKPVTVKYRTLSVNRKLAVSLIELHTTVTKWSFIQCFLAYKTSFVLGDVHFSQNVKQILGQRIAVDPLKQSVRNRAIDYSFEPLSREVRHAIGVNANNQIPLMIHHFGFELPNYIKKITKPHKQKDLPTKDLIIEANTLEQMPLHFIETLNRLDLNIF